MTSAFDGWSALVVSPDFPFPTIHGGRVDIWGRLSALKQLGFRIHLVATVKGAPQPSDIKVVEGVVSKLTLVPRDRGLSQVFGSRPFQIASRHGLASVKLDESYDLLLLESMFTLPILSNPSLRGRLTALKMHNDEAGYSLALAKSTRNVFLKLFYYWEYMRFRRENEALSSRVRTIFFSSDLECAVFKRRYPELDAEHLGGALADDGTVERARNGRRVLFSGSLFMSNNREAVDWYLANVHSRLMDLDGYEFVVVGSTAGVARDWLQKLCKTPGVSLHENVPTMDPYYDLAAVFVNPMRHGTSIKMKTIEALRNGLPQVSTTCGATGGTLIDGEHLLLADDPEQFAAAVRRLLTDRALNDRLAENGHKLIETEYNHSVKLKKLLLPRFDCL